MTVASVFKNRIPGILKIRDMKIADLQRSTGLSYPGLHNIAKEDAEDTIISDNTRLGTLRKICEALGVTLDDLLRLEITPKE